MPCTIPATGDPCGRRPPDSVGPMRSPRRPSLRRAAPAVVVLSLLAAACGDDAAEEGSAATTIAGSGTTDSGETAGSSGSGDAAAECSRADVYDRTVDTSAELGEPAAPEVPDKPEVEIPDGDVTELEVTDLVEGEGDEAVVGDTVVVHYVGVRSEDGTEFDNSYDRGSTFPVTLGAGMVIQGWDEGLVGAKAGARRQLDIPAELAYGDTPQGDVIQPGDALSFVVDVVAVIAATDPTDEPAVEVAGSGNCDELFVTDLVEGDGAELQLGESAYVHLIAYRGDTGEQVASSWETGQPQGITFVEDGALPGLIDGMVGMKVGGRRQMAIPAVDAFGSVGNEGLGIPADVDLVLVIDLIAAF